MMLLFWENVHVTAGFVTDITNWVDAGGTLMAFRPDGQLSSLLGISSASGTLADQYLLVNTTSGPGIGIVMKPFNSMVKPIIIP